MTVHLCRDFLTLPSASFPGTNMYVLAAFLQHVMGFSVIAHVNFPLLSGSNVVAEGLTGELTATINLGPGQECELLLPTASHVVTSLDVNRIVALRSADNPRHNSGLFRVVAVNTGSNVLTIDYRSTQSPPPEGLAFRLYESESSASLSWSSGSNASTGYNSKHFASASRLMMSTNEDLGSWRVRLCLESRADVLTTCPQGMSVAPGVVTTTHQSADFTGDDTFLHGPLFYDTTSSLYRGSAVGPAGAMSTGLDWVQGQWRINIIGEDRLGTTTMVTRNVSLPQGGTGWLSFGIPDDEDRFRSARLTVPEQAQRLFVVGHAARTGSMDWRCAYADRDLRTGVMWSPLKRPLSCVASTYVSVLNVFDSGSAFKSIHARDSQFDGMTTLLDVELIGGTLPSPRFPTEVSSNSPYVFDPRRIGILPFLRQGRANFSPWTITSSSSTSWLHADGGVFMEWGGPPPSGSFVTGSRSYAVPSASFLNGEGFRLDEVNHPGQNPFDPTTVTEKDIDNNRFRKTYSFFRQEPRLVGVTRGGSNPAKP